MRTIHKWSFSWYMIWWFKIFLHSNSYGTNSWGVPGKWSGSSVVVQNQQNCGYLFKSNMIWGWYTNVDYRRNICIYSDNICWWLALLHLWGSYRHPVGRSIYYLQAIIDSVSGNLNVLGGHLKPEKICLVHITVYMEPRRT